MNIIFSTFLLALTVCASDNLLSLSRSHSCLKDLVSQFVRAEDCSHLSDRDKSKLALKMTECLFKDMGRPFPEGCSESDCRLEGDAWSTFTTFFAHVDNLCHFYWETLRHERTETLMGKLSESSSKAEEVLAQNTAQTRKILTMQSQMHRSLEESLQSQQDMAALINSSAGRISNLTQQIEVFVVTLQQDIDANYASIRRLLHIINNAVSQVVQFQGYIWAEITSVAGILFFLSKLFIVLFLTSFQRYQTERPKILMTLAIEVALELLMPSFLHSFLGTKICRYIFLGLMGFQLLGATSEHPSTPGRMEDFINTPRLERALRKVRIQDDKKRENEFCLSDLAAQVCRKLKVKMSEGQSLEE